MLVYYATSIHVCCLQIGTNLKDLIKNVVWIMDSWKMQTSTMIDLRNIKNGQCFPTAMPFAESL